MSDVELDGELVSEEDVVEGHPDDVRALPHRFESQKEFLPALRSEVTTAAIAVAGGALAGVATVAAVRAVSGSGGSKRRQRKLSKRGRNATNVVASRSFLVDVHVLGR
ncbi:MAG: hypothetical protein WBP55_06860 [Solirubrobacterales bacterium]